MRASVVVAVLLLLGAACENQPAAPQTSDILAERALWRSHNLSRYAYVYETTGFLVAYAGRPIRLVVINDSVASAQDATTDSLLPVGPEFPTIEQLFAQAIAARVAGTLFAISFDSTFAFPSRMDVLGPADASGTILASSLQLLP